MSVKKFSQENCQGDAGKIKYCTGLPYLLASKGFIVKTSFVPNHRYILNKQVISLTAL